jgi:hypothetical protein
MDSLLKLNWTVPAGVTSQDYRDSFKHALSQLDELNKVDLIFKKLHFLGIHFDPFQEVTVPEVQQIIEQMNLEIHLSNPYQATNILLQLLDDTEERLKQLKH